MLRFSLDAIASFSYRPLQLATLLGFAISAVAFVAIPVVIVLKITGHYLSGFSTVEITMLLLGGIQLITIGMIGEYVGRIFDEVKGRPLYLVRSRRNFTEGAGPTSCLRGSGRRLRCGAVSRQPPAGFGPPTVLPASAVTRPARSAGRQLPPPARPSRASRSGAPGP